MARIFIDGFESGGMDLWDDDGDFTVTAVNPAKGVYCATALGISNPMKKVIPANGTYYFKWRYRETSNTSAPEDIPLLAVFKGATKLLDIIHRSDEKLEARRGGSVSLGLGSYTSLNDVWHLLEVKIVISDTVGVCQVKINGVLDIDLTNIDTKPGADTTIDTVEFGVGEGYDYGKIDDVVIDDSAWIGNTQIQAVVPTGVGNKTEWDPSAGANWQCVDEKPASDVDYVSTNTNDETDTFATGNMAGSISTVKCVQIQSRTRYEGSPTPTNLKLVIRSGATDYLSGDKSVPASYKGLWNLWENNPADSLAWEEADVNAMEIGVKSAA